MNQLEEGYTIKIRQFEGPFDLLLFFIERDEIDIFDIPISKITADFLTYIRQLEELNIDVASEFILVAATLMRIKAKMLLPRPDLDEDGQEIDPRAEIARKLLEYKRFKDIIGDLSSLEVERMQLEPRGNVTKEIKSIATKALVDVELESLTMFKLLKSFESVMNRKKIRDTKPRHLVYRYNYTLEDQKIYVLEKVSIKGDTSFEDIFENLEDRMHCIITFLSVLELINAEELFITTGVNVNTFVLKRGQAA